MTVTTDADGNASTGLVAGANNDGIALSCICTNVTNRICTLFLRDSTFYVHVTNTAATPVTIANATLTIGVIYSKTYSVV